MASSSPRNTDAARFSTYSGAPSLQPSLAPTFDTHTTSYRSSVQPSSRQHNATQSTSAPSSEKSRTSAVYGNKHAMASSSTLSSTDTKDADIKTWSGALQRMHDERLDRQRYVMNPHKSEEVSKLALGAKVERALARRMVGQDASFRPKRQPQPTLVDVEKHGLEVKAN